MKPILQQGLPTLARVNHHFPRIVAHGPKKYQGLEIPELHLEQLISHIMALLQFGTDKQDITGTLIRAVKHYNWKQDLQDQ